MKIKDRFNGLKASTTDVRRQKYRRAKGIHFDAQKDKKDGKYCK